MPKFTMNGIRKRPHDNHQAPFQLSKHHTHLLNILTPYQRHQILFLVVIINSLPHKMKYNVSIYSLTKLLVI